MNITFTVDGGRERAARWLLNAALVKEREAWRGYTYFDTPIGDERRAEQADQLALLDTLIEQNLERFVELEFLSGRF